jgi:hypothetical protein
MQYNFAKKTVSFSETLNVSVFIKCYVSYLKVVCNMKHIGLAIINGILYTLPSQLFSILENPTRFKVYSSIFRA